MTYLKPTFLVLFVVQGLSVPDNIQAEHVQVTDTYTGTVRESIGTDADTYPPGTRYTLTIEHDERQMTYIRNQGSDDIPWSINLVIGTDTIDFDTFETVSYRQEATNDIQNDFVFISSGTAIDQRTVSNFTIHLNGDVYDAQGAADFFAQPVDVSQFDLGNASFGIMGETGLLADIDGVRFARVVPEPAGWLLLGLGVIVFLTQRKRGSNG